MSGIVMEIKPEYGTITTKQSYFNGELKSKHVWYEESVAIDNKVQLMENMLQLLDTFLNEESDEVELSLYRNKDKKLRLVKRNMIK